MKPGYLYLILGSLLIAVSVVWILVAQTTSNSLTQKSLKTDSQTGKTAEPATQIRTAIPEGESAYYVPILMYHYIRDYQNQSDPLGIQLSVSPDTLDKQLADLESAGYRTISLQDLVEKKFEGKSIILTFDDGYIDHYTEAFPILQKHNMTATFFIVSGFTGRESNLNLEQISQMKKAGMEIGGHSASHPNLANASFQKAFGEIGVSLRNTHPVFAFPSGKYSEETLEILSMLSVKAAVTTDIGIVTDKSKPLELPRIRVKNHTDLIKIIDQEIAISKNQLLPSQRTPD